MANRTTRWWTLALSLGLMLAMGCADEDPVDATDNGDENLPTNQDVDAPLEDLSTLTYDAPDNSLLPEIAKADENFPAQFDIVDTQSPVRSQGSRGVCSIFSTVALMEHLYIKEGTITDPNFSEQYLQWAVKTNDKSIQSFQDSSGSNSNFNLQGISRYGVIEEQFWPYEPSPWGTSNDAECSGDDQPYICHTNGEAPQEARDAPSYRLPSSSWVSTRARDIKAHMFHNETGVVVGGGFYYQAWNHGASGLPTNQDYWREGYVLFPNETDIEASEESPAGHSILLVGWDDNLEVERLDGEGNVMLDDDGEPLTEKGFFIFKNSWGTGSFGINNVHGDGYGYISYEYVQRYKSGRVSAPPEPHHIPEEDDSCTSDTQCGTGEICQDSECVVPECISSDECGTGQVCEENICLDASCDVDSPDCGDPLCLDFPVCEGQEETFEYIGGEQLIPDNDETGVTTEIVVDGSGLIQDLVVDVFIEHTWNGDLQIDLIHPSGESVTIREADGTSGDDVIEAFEVSAFDAMESAGTWQLKVTDNAAQDEGTLIGWDLHIVR